MIYYQMKNQLGWTHWKWELRFIEALQTLYLKDWRTGQRVLLWISGFAHRWQIYGFVFETFLGFILKPLFTSGITTPPFCILLGVFPCYGIWLMWLYFIFWLFLCIKKKRNFFNFGIRNLKVNFPEFNLQLYFLFFILGCSWRVRFGCLMALSHIAIWSQVYF